MRAPDPDQSVDPLHCGHLDTSGQADERPELIAKDYAGGISAAVRRRAHMLNSENLRVTQVSSPRDRTHRLFLSRAQARLARHARGAGRSLFCPRLGALLQLAHRVLGPTVREWQVHRSIPYRTNLWAIALMGSTIAISAVFFITDPLVRSLLAVLVLLGEMMAESDRVKAKRASDAMMKIVKIDIAALEAAFAGTTQAREPAR